MGRRKWLKTIQKSSQSQAKEKSIDSSNEVNQNEESAQFEGGTHTMRPCFSNAVKVYVHDYLTTLNYL